MANAASKEALAAEGKETDWKGAHRVLVDTVKAKKDKVSSINGEISAKYDILEKDGVNKRGAKMFLTLDGLEGDERRDTLRTLEKLGAAAGWDNGADLVDQAEKGDAEADKSNVLEMPKKAKPKKGEEAPSDGDAKIDPAAFKAAYVDRVCEESDMKEADAYVLANKVFDSLTTAEKGQLSHTLAVKKADEEMETWEEDEPTKQ